MLERYSRAAMVSLWSEETRLTLWCILESSLAHAQAARGDIPQEAALAISKHARFDEDLLERSKALEAETQHDVVAFLRAIEERMDAEDCEYSRFLHFGATSSDILDSTLAIQLVQAASMLEQELSRLLVVIARRAREHKETLCLGRSHGMAAEPTTFGLKLLSYYAEFQRARERLRRARSEVSTISLSGTIGHYAFLHPQVESAVTEHLNRELPAVFSTTLRAASTSSMPTAWELRIEPIATQVIPRDRHAVFFSTLGVIASSLERFSLEIRHLQRSDVGEVSEAFSSKQTGSSAMPHKRNPILSENITGLARLVRMPMQAALENIALWHERDISHSSVERVIAPDTTVMLDFALARMTKIVDGLQVFPERMVKNLEATKGVLFSHGLLLRLLRNGITRKRAYKIVQRTSMQALDGGEELTEVLKRDEEANALLSAEDFATLCNHHHYTRHVDALFERVLSC